MPTGKVKWFDVTKGYGFITADDGGPDVFLHLSKVQESNLPTLEAGTPLQYSIGNKNGKVFAEGLSVRAPKKDVDRLSPTSEERLAEESDFDNAFEKEWGLRRS